jgi:hypothetical protein
MRRLICTDCKIAGTTSYPVRRILPMNVPLCVKCFRMREKRLIREWDEWFRKNDTILHAAPRATAWEEIESYD